MKWNLSLCGLALVAAVLAAQQPPAAPDPIATQTNEDLAQGKRLFQAQCSLCHGATGEGGKGPSLVQPKLSRAADNHALFQLLRDGIFGTEMPGAWQMTDREVWQVAGYVRSLGRLPVIALSGDPARGKAIYEGKGGCSACHIVRGQGGSFGPDLTDVGLRRSPAYLRQALLDPGASAPKGFLMVRAITRAGREVEGIRASEDSFTIQLRDAGGRFYSFRKSRLAKLEKEFGKSPMPGYASALSASEMDDLIAYLAGLRGER